MNPLALAIAVTTLPLLLLGGVAGRRWRILGALGLFAIALTAGILAEVLVTSDLWTLPQATGLGADLLLLGLWAVLGAVVRAGGPLMIPGPPVVVAMVSGALLGEVPAAAILASGARTRSGAARLALAAAAGGMIGRVGDPAVQLFSARDPFILVQLVPLAILLGVMAAPRRDDLGLPGEGARARTGLLAAVAAAALVPGWAPLAVLVGIAGSVVLSRDTLKDIDFGWVLWVGVAAMLGLFAIAGGLPEMGATGLELIGEQMGGWGAPGLALAGALLSALSDGTAAAMCAVGIYDGAMSLSIPGAALAMAAGVAVGGCGPLIAAGAWRAGWKRWALQVIVTVVYVGLVTQ